MKVAQVMLSMEQKSGGVQTFDAWRGGGSFWKVGRATLGNV